MQSTLQDPLDKLIGSVSADDPLDELIAGVGEEPGYAEHIGGWLVRGAGQVAGSALKGLTRVAHGIATKVGEDRSLEETTAYKVADSLQHMGEGMGQRRIENPVGRFLATDVPQGFGSMAGLLPAAVAGPLGVGMAGASAGANQGYEQAKAAGATPGQTLAATIIEGALGATEMAGAGAGGPAKGFVRGVLGEMIQEGGQTLGSQIKEKLTYAPDRQADWGEVARAAGVGGIVGAGAESGGALLALNGRSITQPELASEPTAATQPELSTAAPDALDELIAAVPAEADVADLGADVPGQAQGAGRISVPDPASASLLGDQGSLADQGVLLQQIAESAQDAQAAPLQPSPALTPAEGAASSTSPATTLGKGAASAAAGEVPTSSESVPAPSEVGVSTGSEAPSRAASDSENHPLLARSVNVEPGDPRFAAGNPIDGIPDKRMRSVEQPNFRAIVPEGSLWHDTNLDSARKIVAKAEGRPTRSHDVYVSDNVDLARGQGAAGVLIEFDPARVNGRRAPPKPGLAYTEGAGAGRELIVEQSVKRSVLSLTAKTKATLAALGRTKGLPDLFDFENAQQTERGWRVERKAKPAPAVEAKPAAAPTVDAPKIAAVEPDSIAEPPLPDSVGDLDAWNFSLLAEDFRPKVPPSGAVTESVPDSFDLPKETNLQAIERKVRDRLNRFRTVQAATEKQGARVSEDADVDLAASLLPGRAAERVAKIEKGPEKTLARLLRTVPIADADRYLVARHTPARRALMETRRPKKAAADPRFGSGMSVEEAAEVVSKAEAGPNGATYRHIASIVERLNNQARAARVEAGILSEEGRRAWEDKYGRSYVPLKNAPDDPSFVAGTGHSMAVRDQTRRAEGRTSEAASPIVHSLVDAKLVAIQAEKNKVGQAIATFVRDNPDPSWEVTEHPKKRDIGKGYALPFMEDGVETFIVVRDELYARAFKGLGVEDAPKFLRLLSRVMRFYGQLLTAKNPEFIASNLVRDLGTAEINVSAEQSRAFAKAFRNPKAIGRAIKTLYTLARNPDVQGPEFERAREFATEGGKTGWAMAAGFEGQLEAIQKATLGPKRGARRVWDEALRFIEDVNQATENATRLHAYNVAIDQGISKRKAARLARELTVDFNRKGESGPVLNALYLFANANIQGSTRILRGLATNPRLRRMSLGMAAAGYALSALNRAIDDDEWEKRSKWEKSRNLIVMTPGAAGFGVKVPLPWGFGLFFHLGALAEEMVSGAMTPADAGMSALAAARSNFDPIGGSTLLQFVSPTAFRPVVEVEENKNAFGSAIMPRENPFDKTPPPDSERFFNSVSPNARDFAQWMNSVTGGSSTDSGLVDVSPETLEHFADFFSAGVGQFVRRLSELPQRVGSGEWTLRDVPILRRFASLPEEERFVKKKAGAR